MMYQEELALAALYLICDSKACSVRGMFYSMHIRSCAPTAQLEGVRLFVYPSGWIFQ